MTLEELKSLPMEYTFGYTAHDHAVRQYQNSDHKIWYRDWETDRKSTRLNSSHLKLSRMPSSA